MAKAFRCDRCRKYQDDTLHIHEHKWTPPQEGMHAPAPNTKTYELCTRCSGDMNSTLMKLMKDGGPPEAA